MTRIQIALIVVTPLLLVVILTAVNRFWGWPTDSLRIPLGLVSASLLLFYFSKQNQRD